MEEDSNEREEENYLRNKNILLRNYQLRLIEKIKLGNSILYLPTGAGKTLIAIHVLCSRNNDIKRPFSEGGKRAFFLATTKVLVYQLFKVLQTHTKFRVACFTGDMNVDAWSREKWMTKLEDTHVMVLTPEIIKQILQMKYILPRDISLVVFDECHHAVENHPYRLVLKTLCDDPSEGPLLLGLSAVLLNSNPKKGNVAKDIADLETAFRGKVIIEPQLQEVLSFSAAPIQKIVTFKEHSEVSVDPVVEFYESVICVAESMTISPVNSSIPLCVPATGIDFKNRNRGRRIKNSFVNLKAYFNEFGLFGGSIAALFYIILLEKARLLSTDPVEIQALIYAVTELNKIRHITEKIMGTEETSASIVKFSSYKVRQLLTIIREVKEAAKEKHISILIFVHQRVSAIVLAFIFKRLSAVDSYFSFIKADFVVGNSIFSRESLLIGSSNEDIVRQFASGSLNLLVATNLLEEGIDISDCNVVISFDFPLLYPSYFQSRGRARNNDSLHYLFINEGDQMKKLDALSEFAKIEKELFELVSEFSSPTDSEGGSKKTIESIALSNNLTVDAILAIRAVYRYCSMLPQDRFCNLSPVSWYTAVGETRKGFLQFPVNCPLREVIEGEVRSNKTEAKRSVFLIALKRLYQMGELDDNLNVRSSEVKGSFDHLFGNYKNEHIDKNLPQPGTKKRKQMYRMKFAESLSCCLPRPGVKVYLHVIDFSVAFDKPELRRKQLIYDVLRNPVTFAIISTKKLCKIFRFPLFLDMGQINCDLLVNYDEMVFNEAEINDIKSCHFALFKKVIKSVKNGHVFDNSNREHSFFVAPVEKNEEGRFVLSWDLIRSDFCRNSRSALVRYNPTASREFSTDSKRIKLKLWNTRDVEESSTSLVPLDAVKGQSLWGVGHDELNEGPAFTMTEADYKLFIVVPNYRKQDPPQYYMVDKFCRDMSPLSPFPRESYEDFITYYEYKYMITVTNARQPLILVCPLFNCSNFNKPRNRKFLREREKAKEYEEHLIPELCDVIRFDRRFWVKTLLIPTVLNRICHVYCVEEFRRRIVSETGLGVCELPEETDWKPLEADEVCVDREEDGGISAIASRLNFALPLSDLKDKTQSKRSTILDPERHLYEYGLCDLEYYVKCLMKVDAEDLQLTVEENEELIKLIRTQTAPVPPLEILKGGKSRTGPDLALLVQACTAKSANDIVNLERLETLGDSFLKFGTTLYLFRNHDENEGILTSVKGKLVGNRNLLYCGLAKNIQHVVNVIDFVPFSEWTAPLFSVPERIVEGIVRDKVDPAVLYGLEFTHEEQFSGVLSENTLEKNEEILRGYDKSYDLPANPLMPYKIVEDKTIADCVEALIGTYLLSSGLPAAFTLLSWLGVLPKSNASFSELIGKPHAVHLFGSSNSADILNMLGEVFYSELEDILNYRFKNKALLLEALTHPSYQKNRTTGCYQRLEFLGDAVLDFLVTTYLYENCNCLTPGQITDIRASLVNNITFASFVVRYDLQKYMLSFSSSLSKAVENFVSFQKNRNHVVDENVLILLEEKDCMIAEAVEVPKALGDLFESLAGAIFLDSGNSLETVWSVYYKFMKKELDEFTKNVPKTSVRLLQEICGDKPYYEARVLKDGNVKVTCSVYYENREIKAYGFGSNKKDAKRSASKLVLNKILATKR